jgi:hypothetical protein
MGRSYRIQCRFKSGPWNFVPVVKRQTPPDRRHPKVLNYDDNSNQEENHMHEVQGAQMSPGAASITGPGHELISGCTACPFLSERREWKCTADEGPSLNDGVPDHIHGDCPHLGKVLAWPSMNRAPCVFPNVPTRHVAYAVLAIDTETAEINGVGIFSEPGPTLMSMATVVLFQIAADDYKTAQATAWAQLGAYPWIEKAFPVVQEHRHSRTREGA